MFKAKPRFIAVIAHDDRGRVLPRSGPGWRSKVLWPAQAERRRCTASSLRPLASSALPRFIWVRAMSMRGWVRPAATSPSHIARAC